MPLEFRLRHPSQNCPDRYSPQYLSSLENVDAVGFFNVGCVRPEEHEFDGNVHPRDQQDDEE